MPTLLEGEYEVMETRHLFKYDGAELMVPIWQNYQCGRFESNQFTNSAFKFTPIYHTYRVWTGIGSRQTPADVGYWQKQFSAFMSRRGWILRTGDAAGSDKNFLEGTEYTYGGNFEKYTPKDGLTTSAMESVVHFHPNPPALGHPDSHSFRLMGRNFYQLTGHPKLTRLNQDTGYLSQFVVGYAPGGFVGGGTSQAFRIARHFGIPVYNLFRPAGTETNISDGEYARMVFYRILKESYVFSTGVVERWMDFTAGGISSGRQCF